MKKRSILESASIIVLAVTSAVLLFELALIDMSKTSIISFDNFSIWVFLIFVICIYAFENMFTWLIDIAKVAKHSGNDKPKDL